VRPGFGPGRASVVELKYRWRRMTDQSDSERLQQRLSELIQEHRDLDDVIARLEESAPFDQIQLKRLKKRKLMLKDEMARVENLLLPDIIA
jgi:hypothetical protein